jgi:hypothetical protein
MEVAALCNSVSIFSSDVIYMIARVRVVRGVEVSSALKRAVTRFTACDDRLNRLKYFEPFVGWELLIS